ncbi:MAG: phosphotriesterase [Breznakia sp.]
MPFIRTLLKDIDPKELGITNAHEHIVCRPPYWIEHKQDDLLLDDEKKSLLDVLDFKELGGKSIVDATAIDYGRDVEAVVRISKKSNIQFVGTAGFNKSFLWDAAIPKHLKKIIGQQFTTYKEWIEKSTIQELVNFVCEEIEVGLEGTRYKAGQVKFGTAYNSIKPLEIKTLKVACEVHKQTGAPIHSHTEAGTMALEQIELLKAEGIDLSCVTFGHMDRNIDPYYHKKIAESGAFLSFDGLGKNKYGPESNRIAAILYLVKLGYEDQIVLGGDTARKSYYKHYDYGIGLEFLLKKWIPRFLEECTNNDLDGKVLVNKFLIINPARALTFREVK